MPTPNKPTAVPKKEGTPARCQAYPAHLKAKTKGSLRSGFPHLAAQINYAPQACCAHSRNPLHIHLCSKPAL